MDFKEIIAQKEIQLIMKKYQKVIIDSDTNESFDVYTTIFDKEISCLSKDTLKSLHSLTGSSFFDDDYGQKKLDKEIFLQVFKQLKTKTKKELMVFRGGYLKEGINKIYSSTMSFNEVKRHAPAGYKEINCILIKKGSVIIPTASVCRAQGEGIDSEHEIALLSDNIHHKKNHLWIYE